MRSKAPGLMATLLMFVPLLAVPFLAGFGVPWLAAKSRGENLPIPDLSPPLLESEIGHSHSGRHSAEDLFAPVTTQPAVDLRMKSDDTASQTPAQAQNPHLRNASLVVSHDGSWEDPFEAPVRVSPAEQPLEEKPLLRQAVNPTQTDPQTPLEGWTVQEQAAETSAPARFPSAGTAARTARRCLGGSEKSVREFGRVRSAADGNRECDGAGRRDCV